MAVSCTKPDVEDPGGGTVVDPITTPTALPSLSKFFFPEDFEIPSGGTYTLPYSGLSAGDRITMTMRYDASESYEMVCTGFDSKEGGIFSVPKKFIGGMCNVHLSAGGISRDAECFVSVKDTAAVERKSGMTSYGRVVDYEGNPIPDVVVSDGVLTTKTDEEGRWWLASVRKRGYVFISVPSGYRVAVRNSVPQFFSRFESSKSSDYEIHSFVLAPDDNVRHRTYVFTDTHLARRTNDIAQFEESFKAEMKTVSAAARAEGLSFYALALGDLAWDQYWYDNNYSLVDYAATMAELDIPIYSIPGNHDNDPYVADDFLSENAFRANVCPTYYSFNIGKIHYIMMDDTIFNNAGGSQGTIGNVQDYQTGFTSDELKWLRADLQSVEPGTTIIMGVHIQYTSRPYESSDGTFPFNYNMPAEYRQELTDLFEGYNVHIVSGHTHVNYTNRIADNILEHNNCAVCATWWWTGYYTSGRCRINGDGSPCGYKIFELGEDGASSLSWSYKAVDRSSDYQFRAYDLNNCKITRALYCPKSDNPKVSDDFFSQYADGYDEGRSDNKILINVFDWDDTWSISVKENGKELNVVRTDAYDPLHVVHFNMARMNSNSTAMTFPTNKASHFFIASASGGATDVTITVTDGFGKTYTEVMSRPRTLYDMSKSDKW